MYGYKSLHGVAVTNQSGSIDVLGETGGKGDGQNISVAELESCAAGFERVASGVYLPF